MNILDKIHSSADVKSLTPAEVKALCGELREQITLAVSKSGGHLASNLGAVELTVALHRVYDSSKDRLVFDVGHQCYAHKMLTGRLGRFDTLRSYGGLSGFPKPCESADDPCISGHASTSVSNALGFARARTLSGEKYDVCAIIGDGAMTGGLAYEGMADCGASGESIVVVLNDNAMSISSNVGGVALAFSRLRMRPGYVAFKRLYHKTVGRIEPAYRVFHAIKEKIKDIFLPDNMFENLGFYYIGPVDGHNVAEVERALRYARELAEPVLVHVITVKGKGYAPAEQTPELYHGVGPFDLREGVVSGGKASFSETFGSELAALAESDGRIAAITAAMSSGTGLDGFALRFPERFFDVGIAEGHAVSMAAGMALGGMKPVFAVYSSFLQRSYDMLIHDVALSGAPVVLAVDRAGLVGADGETHQGSFDVSYLRSVPNLTLYSPSSFAELRSMLRLALDLGAPAALRYPKGAEGGFVGDTSGKPTAVLREGADVTLVSYGIMINEALAAADRLSALGVEAAVVKLNRLTSPELDPVMRGGRIVVIEDCCAAGCVGGEIACRLSAAGIAAKIRLLNLGSGVVQQGKVDILRKDCGIDAESVVSASLALMGDTYEKNPT